MCFLICLYMHLLIIMSHHWSVCWTGLRESSLYTILNMCNDLNSRGGLVTWQETLHTGRHPESRVPMATFSQLVRTLHRYNTWNILTKEVKTTFGENWFVNFFLIIKPDWTVSWSVFRWPPHFDPSRGEISLWTSVPVHRGEQKQKSSDHCR